VLPCLISLEDESLADDDGKRSFQSERLFCPLGELLVWGCVVVVVGCCVGVGELGSVCGFIFLSF
jgi:hypothetical protein